MSHDASALRRLLTIRYTDEMHHSVLRDGEDPRSEGMQHSGNQGGGEGLEPPQAGNGEEENWCSNDADLLSYIISNSKFSLMYSSSS